MKHHYLPLRVAGGRVSLEPCELIVAECLVLAEIICVEHDEVRVIVIIRIKHAALSVLIDSFGQYEVLIEHISALLVVA